MLTNVVVVVKKVSNATLVSVLSGLQTGAHLSNPAVEYIKVKGFKLEPTSPGTENVKCVVEFVDLRFMMKRSTKQNRARSLLSIVISAAC